MGSLTVSIKYNVNSGIILSQSELIEGFFHGISLKTKQGESLSQQVILDKIKFAQAQLENTLGIKFAPTCVTEERDFVRSDYKSWGFVKTTYPVRYTGNLSGYLNNTLQILYPEAWVSKKESSIEENHNRNIHLVPAGSQAEVSSSVVFAGITPHLGFMGMNYIPNYWNASYATGFMNKIPYDLYEAMGKIAAIPIFAILGDILLGAGIASQSLSFDGLSQSIATTQSAENSAYSARIRQYLNELKTEIPRLVHYYKGINFEAA